MIKLKQFLSFIIASCIIVSLALVFYSKSLLSLLQLPEQATHYFFQLHTYGVELNRIFIDIYC
jgi:hypothetical protein